MVVKPVEDEGRKLTLQPYREVMGVAAKWLKASFGSPIDFLLLGQLNSYWGGRRCLSDPEVVDFGAVGFRMPAIW
jgi:hypothetical protein